MIMIYVNDKDRGRISICELDYPDREYIMGLLHGILDRTDNPTIFSKARLLVVGLNSPDTESDYEIGWSDVFLLSALLLNELVAASNTRKEQADRLLAAFESAAENIIDSTAQSIF